jgi:Predicted membrane protein
MDNGYAVSNNPLWVKWRERSIATVNHDAILQRIVEESGWSPRYAFMIIVSAGIAILGLLLPSSAVLIGAMLLSPLMMPIIGLGFALATLDFAEMRASGFALAVGAVIAIAFTALFVVVSPVQTVTTEIAARTRPNLFDLLVAFFSALAGGYALIRGRGETVVGVAIAIALMPPLAAVGFGIATWNWTIAGGAFLLFMTNTVTITLTAAFMARLYGFGSHLTPAHTRLQSIVMVVCMTALSVPLALTLRHIAWETLAARQVRDAIQQQFPQTARISDLETDFSREPIRVVATVLTPSYAKDAEQQTENSLREALQQELDVTIDQIQVGAGTSEAAQVAAAQSRERTQARDRFATAAVDRLALVAGVSSDVVLVDRENRRASVAAQPLAGASLDLYRQLERRAATGVEEWTLVLTPPPVPLPAIGFSGDALTQDGAANLDLAVWAARRVPLGITITGQPARAEMVRDIFRAQQIPDARLVVTPNGGEDVRLSWRLPE